MPREARYASIPFREAETYFRQKVSVPTDVWTDLIGAAHDRAFVVAGATKMDLIADLRAAVEKAIAQGTTLEEFRKDFDDLVKRHGWRYRGDRAWRTEVIYGTNLRTAWAAGRYKQMMSAAELASRPYWLYKHGRPKRPRKDHLSWDDLVLPATDPWWNEHYPPNGWGCTCRAFSVSQRDLDERGLTVGTAPADGRYDWQNPSTGEVVSLPKGVEPGWSYAPGASWAQMHGDKLERSPYDLATANVRELVNSPVFARWFSKHAIPNRPKPIPEDFFPVGVIDTTIRDSIGAREQVVWLSPETLSKEVGKHGDLILAEYRVLPELLERGRVYQDNDRTVAIFHFHGRDYMAAMTTTKSGLGNFVLTFHRISDPMEEQRIIRGVERRLPGKLIREIIAGKE